MYLCPCPNRKLCDLDGVSVDDQHLSADQVLVLTQFMDHPFEVFVAGKLFGNNSYTVRGETERKVVEKKLLMQRLKSAES